MWMCRFVVFFFFQAEDGIRDIGVTGVQTCALPIWTPNPVLLVRLGCIGGLAASALIWWAPSTAVVIVGFALLGAVLAPVFPALVTLTPVRIGHARAQHAIGWQIAGANVGATGISVGTVIILKHE